MTQRWLEQTINTNNINIMIHLAFISFIIFCVIFCIVLKNGHFVINTKYLTFCITKHWHFSLSVGNKANGFWSTLYLPELKFFFVSNINLNCSLLRINNHNWISIGNEILIRRFIKYISKE
jgi:hypothetical protein